MNIVVLAVMIGAAVIWLVFFLLGISAETISNISGSAAKAQFDREQGEKIAAWEKRKLRFEAQDKRDFEKKAKSERKKYDQLLAEWNERSEHQKSIWEARVQKDLDEWKERVRSESLAHEEREQRAIVAWEAECLKVKQKNDQAAKKAEDLRIEYSSGDAHAIERYAEISLNLLHGRYGFSPEIVTQYHAENRVLLVECELPSLEDLPQDKEIKFIKSRNEIRRIPHSQPAINKLYDDVAYKLTLASIQQLFENDEADHVDAIIFNGRVKGTSKATGRISNACILSIQVSKVEFKEIELQKVDPKDCFFHLQGVGTPKLHSITPVAPISTLSTDDNRFVDPIEVASSLHQGSNLAAMDWQDFEHLVRQVIQAMFKDDGVEVKVTQSSRDKGVDAIAFNPDPVMGGKIIIQAKRYTNVVGVSAVRDLYGTVMNEGAMKGILVTTSNYGNDSYDFCKGKPLTLISGGELLSILNKQGLKAHIDIDAARQTKT